MFPRALRIARIGGVEVRIDPSWLLIALVFVWFFYARFATVADRTPGAALAMAVVAALLFFLSVLAHELAHALEARHRDLEVRGITLFLFGGVTEMRLQTDRPVDEFAVSAVGPYMSLVAAATFGIVATFAGQRGFATVAEVAGTLGWINAGLALFNLIPGAPLDGGRVLRSIVWAVTGNRERAVRIASTAGQVVAGMLFLFAAWIVVARPEALFDALWMGLIAWFIWQAAVAERHHGELEALLADRTVGSLLTSRPPALPADRPLHLVADQIASSPGFEVYPVVADGVADGVGAVVGALYLEDVMAVEPADRTFRTAGEVMRRIERVPSIHAGEPVQVLLGRIDDEPLLKIVDDEGNVSTLASRGQVIAALERFRALARERRRRGRRGGVAAGTVEEPDHIPHRDGEHDGGGPA